MNIFVSLSKMNNNKFSIEYARWTIFLFIKNKYNFHQFTEVENSYIARENTTSRFAIWAQDY